MEPFPKRQRLYAPLSRAFPQSFDNQQAYYDDQADEVEDDFEDELQEEYEEVEEEEEEDEEVSDPDADLQQRRARLDYKLKSTFEAIFEKYGQDFEGVGDEIDLETGEIVVNNGHLLEMHDERDAGDTSRRNLIREYTAEAEEMDDIPGSSVEETEVLDDEDDDGEDEEEVLSEDEEMMEDDMILRGFAKANRFVQASPELGSSRAVIPPRREPRPFAASRPAVRGNALPSRTDILAQFGPQLGPQIVDFVSHQQVPTESHIEPAWRAPELPSFAPVKRPVVKRATLAPEVQRSPSPEASRSIWAPARTRAPRKPKSIGGNAVFQGHSVKAAHNRNQPQNPFRRQSMDDLSLAYQAALPSSKRIRRNFTAEDDQIIVDWVARARARGQKVLSEVVWNELEARHPNHSASSWKAHYKRCFTYLPDQKDDYGSESEFSAVEAPPALPGVKKKRTAFTEEDDEILVDWAEIGRERGLPLWSERHWQELADKYPHHSMKSWMGRYQNRFRYLWSNEAGDSESIASETSVGTHILEEREAAKARAPAVSHVPTRPQAPERPSRIRKPAQRDSRIISWSEAVDTIQSLDPVLHAEMLEDTRMMKASNISFDYPGSMSNPTKSFSTNRPRLNQSAGEHRPRNSGRTFDDFIGPENHADPTAVEASPPREETKVRAPCPHADCRPYGTIRYRLQRLDNEDLSEMCLHLFRVHHTTPFPCGELGCKRKGEDGFFMQADLVKHVRLEHPNAGALQRLRGRVDPELLDRNSVPPKNINSGLLNDRPVSQAKDSDFMSPLKRNDRRITASSRPFSSSSEHDRTPRGATDILEASTSTPMTSLSSLEVNRSSGTTVVMREVSESQEIMMPVQHADEHINTNCAGQVLTQQVDELASTKGPKPVFRDTPVEGPPLPGNSAGRNILPTPLASTWDSPRQEGHGPSSHHDNPQSTSSICPESGTVLQLPKHISSSAIRTASGSQLPPPRKSTNPQSSSNKGRTSSLPEPSIMAPPKKAPTSQSFSRNAVDPSYEFSDEEVGIEPVAKPLDLTSKIAPRALPPPATQTSTTTSTEIQSAAIHSLTQPSDAAPATRPSPKKPAASATKSSVATPANPQKSMLERVLEDDYDELSLGADDFVFMFSRQRTDVLPSSLVQVKQEESTDTPQMVTSVPTRKRKLSMFRAGSDDELCVLGPSPPQQPQSTISKPAIKIEDDDGRLPILQPTKPKAGVKRVSIMQAEASSSQPKSQGRRMVNTYAIRTSTPLLDLTPSRIQANNLDGREIRDSAGESSPPNQASSPTHPRKRTRGQREAGTSSPLTGLLSPVRRKRWSGDPLKGEQITVVVKTPGGTLRRCGEDAFECGRTFCFRCGVKAT